MALIKCPECGKKISDKANVCIHCGYPVNNDAENQNVAEERVVVAESIQEEKSEKRGKRKVNLTILLLSIVIALALIGTMVCFFVLKPSYEDATTQYETMHSSYNSLIDSYRSTSELIKEKNDELNAAINDLQKLVSSEEKPYDPNTIVEANLAINEGKIALVDITTWEERNLKNVADYNLFQVGIVKKDIEIIESYINQLADIMEMMEIPEYSLEHSEIDEAKKALEFSIKQMQQVTCPSESFVLQRIMNIRNQARMKDIISLTEDNDPENYIGKAGWYTVKIVFHHKDVEHYGLDNGSLSLNEVGNPAGGCIEVYRTEEDAQRRADQLKSQEGTAKNPGARMICGTIVIRVSDRLKASYQQELLSIIADELLRVEPEQGSEDTIVEFNYLNAVALMDAGKYQQAIIAFGMLGDYKDSADRIIECNYLNAVTLMEEREFQEALTIFEILDSYKDSREKISFCQQGVHYNEVVAYAEDYPAKAAIAFAKMGDFLDAKKRSMELWDQVAEREYINSGELHTVGLRSDGTVVATGYNRQGQCNVENWTDIIAVSTKKNFTVGLKSDGTVVATGENTYGQCDVDEWTDIVAISAGFCHTVGLRSDGTVVATGSNSSKECEVGTWTDIVGINAGDCTIGIKADGTVITAGGWGNYDVSSWTDIISVRADSLHVIGLRSDGTVVATGNNSHGECNVREWTDIVAIDDGGFRTVGLVADGTIVTTDNNSDRRNNINNWTNVVAFSAGSNQTIAQLPDGTLVATGHNLYGGCDVQDWSDIKIKKATVPSVSTPDDSNMENSASGINPSFKAAMDSYEAFMDEYVAFMKKYKVNPNDVSLLADYVNYMSKYSEFVRDFEKWEDEELNADELAYYIDVQARVSKKVLEISQ